MSLQELPREQGKQAFMQGKLARHNPYPRHSNSWYCWMEGYLWANMHRKQLAESVKTAPQVSA